MTQASSSNLEKLKRKLFPGMGHDLGRMRLRVVKAGKPRLEGFGVKILNLFICTIESSDVLADWVLKSMLRRIKMHIPATLSYKGEPLNTPMIS